MKNTRAIVLYKPTTRLFFQGVGNISGWIPRNCCIPSNGNSFCSSLWGFESSNEKSSILRKGIKNLLNKSAIVYPYLLSTMWLRILCVIQQNDGQYV